MNNIALSRILSITLYILLAASGTLAILFYSNVVNEEPLIIWAYILVGTALILSVIFPIFHLITNPKSAKRSLIGLATIVLIIIISYTLASDKILHLINYTGTDNVPTTLKYAGTGLITMYILGGIAVISVLVTEIRSFFK